MLHIVSAQRAALNRYRCQSEKHSIWLYKVSEIDEQQGYLMAYSYGISKDLNVKIGTDWHYWT